MDTRSVFPLLFVLNFVYAADLSSKAKGTLHGETSDSSSTEKLNSDDRNSISDFTNEFQRKVLIQESVSELQTQKVEHKPLGRENVSLSRKLCSFEQAGGHHDFKKDHDGFLMKPSPRPGELQFYQEVTNSEDPTLQKLKSFIPEFGGPISIEGVTYIRMKNIIADYDSPSIMDIKMGFQIWDPTTSERKIAKRKMTYVAMRNQFHFCIQGFECKNVLTDANEKGTKIHFKSMEPEEGLKTLYKFVNGEIGLRAGIVGKMVEQLKEIASWFEDQRKYNFYASSIFLTYDATDLKPFILKDDEADRFKSGTHQKSRPNDIISLVNGFNSLEAAKSYTDVSGNTADRENFRSLTGENELKVRVRMIDFNHVLKSNEKDENYLSGLKRLIKVLENLDALNKNPKLLETLFPAQDAKVTSS